MLIFIFQNAPFSIYKARDAEYVSLDYFQYRFPYKRYTDEIEPPWY